VVFGGCFYHHCALRVWRMLLHFGDFSEVVYLYFSY
jgi:hypothetical protein